MARLIEGILYRLTLGPTYHWVVECESKQDLFELIAKRTLMGDIIVGVNELCKDGSTPRVKVYTDKEYKAIYKRLAQEFKDKKPVTVDDSIPDTEITELCPHCDTEVTMEWDVNERGYEAFCPVCGKKMMLCSMCDCENCNWNAADDTCKMCRKKDTKNKTTENSK